MNVLKRHARGFLTLHKRCLLFTASVPQLPKLSPSKLLNTLKQHKELACIVLCKFRSQPEVAFQFHALREEHIQFIASFL